MADKVEFYSQMAQFEAVNITQTHLNWSGFLAAAARFYKYPYDAQLMIYYQRPEATAVAPYDTWNIQMRRYIKRGSKGIAVLDNSGDAPKVQYLFDIADTGTRYNSRSPNHWKLLQEHEPMLQSYLEDAYGIEHEVGILENQLEVLAMDLANRYWEDNSSQLIDILAGTHISEYDSFTQGANFRKALSNSILYQLISRCFGNADDFLGEEDFEEVPDFDTPKAASALGTAVSTLSSQVLREIERAVRSYDRQKENERSNESYDRTDLHPSRGLPVPEYPTEGNRTEAPDQVRQDAQSLSSGTQPDSVQPAGADGTAVPAPVGDSGNRTEPDRADDLSDGKGSRSDGSSESIRPDEVGGADELPESTGGGDRDEGAYLQLGFMMPTEAEQIQNIETQAESVQPSAFSIDDTEISRALRSGSGYSGGKLRIAAAFATIADSKERSDFLKKEYGIGGRSWDFSDGSRGFVDYDSKGLLIKSWEYKLTVKLKWPEVEKRIGKLVESGEYLTAPEKERFAALEEEYAGRGGIPTPNPAFVYPPAQVEEFHSDNPRMDAMMNFAAQVAVENDYAEPQRFTVVDTPDGNFQIRDSIHDGIYTEQDGTQRVFDDEESADQYMQEITEEAQRQSAEDWLALERAKLPPQALLSDAEFAQQYLIPGETQLEMEGRQFLIDRVNMDSNSVNMQDITFVQNAGFPIFRTEPISYVRRFIDIEPVTETEYTAETVAEYSSESTNLPYDIVVEKLHFDEPVQEPTIPAQNYHITDFNLGEGGAKAKFRMNMEAIHLLKELEQADRNATPEEQKVLSCYVGWGGLADAFDDSKSAWAAEYAELSAALTPEEYAAARASTLNAHYTGPTVIKAIYDAVGLMGFQSGNILEPAMGVGNFFGMLPELMQDSKLYGVELDSITGRIAQKLYPNAEITVAGFETTDRRDFYDLAIGNVPFGNYKVSDKPYDKLGFSIHNYFFAKALDQVRPGGVVAFVTSRYTMDSKSTDARKYLAQRAELLGAIRLPNDAFKANAGTEVVSDIIFLQKRDHPIDIEPDWVHLGQSPEGFAINSYFVEHPEMVMGTLAEESTQYGMGFTVQPLPAADLGEQLHEAVLNIRGIYQPAEITVEEAAEVGKFIPADPNVKNFSYTVVDGEVYFRENSIMRLVEMNDTVKSRIKGMVALREIVNELIEYQMEDYPDEDIASKQRELNAAYDDFTKKYGLINDKANNKAFSEDSSYYLLCSLENLDEEQKLKSKADMFTKRTIRPERKVVSVDTPSEALAISIGERGNVDLPFMAQLMGTPGEYERITSELKGVIFLDPMTASDVDETKGWQTADEYLSGNVRDKLRIAQLSAKSDSRFSINVEALQKAQPKDLEASEIDVRLGATWVDRDYIEQFMHETFDTPWYAQRSIQVKYSEFTAEWQITNKSNLSRNDVAAYVTYGTERANAYRILEETLNLKDIRIYDTIEDPDGKEKRVLNKKETTLAQQKQQAIKDAFQDWIWKDPERREHLVRKYNELFNSSRPREYDGSHIRFGGMNPDINLREHQRNAIAHVLYGGNTLLAHEVGAGKTFEMAASAMELKRLGLCQKSLFVVPNHLTLQWASEFIRLYPSAKLLVANRKDFDTANRKKFCARIATGDYDAVIIGHSQFEKIPISTERQERILQEQIDEITNAIEEMKLANGERFSIKQMEKTRKSLEARLDKLTSDERKDDVITFEQLGVDRLFVDESHAYKNLFLYTKMRNVAGLSTSEAQKSSDMFMKCRYMDELTGGRGVIFATGTPVSNSMTELYTVMRYLQYSTLQQKKLTHFDCWASTFGETTTAIELAPEGTGYRARTRFAKFFNLPELMNMFKEVADIKTSDLLHLPVPEAKFETVVVEPSEIQAEMVHQLSERAAAVHSGVVDASQDNMLCITSDGKKIGLDQRLMNPELPDDPNSKLNSCVGNVFRIWEETKEKKLTQLLFCDMSTPKGDGSFNVYDDIWSKLIAQGVPEAEIAFIHSADTEAKKQELFRKVRTGQVRVLLGSTQKMGAGTNVQDLLVAVHHLDIGWRPADLTQRNGRIIRQGNQNKEVQVYNYVTNGTFDAYCWQTLENKQKFISQIMTSKSPVRSCDDVDEQALSYAEIKALCAGNPLIKEKMDLDIEVARLKVLKADHQSQQYRLEDKLLKYFPGEIEKQKGFVTGFKKDIETAAAHPQGTDDFCGIEIMGKHYAEKADAGEAILSMVKLTQSNEPVTIGNYRGFAVELYFDAFFNQINMNLHGEIRHRVSLGSDARGNLVRMDNVLSGIPERLQSAEIQLTNLENQREAAKAELGKPFPQAEELAAKSARLAELDAQLNMEDRTPEHEHEEPTSMMDDLKRKSGEIQPPKRGSRNYEEER